MSDVSEAYAEWILKQAESAPPLTANAGEIHLDEDDNDGDEDDDEDEDDGTT